MRQQEKRSFCRGDVDDIVGCENVLGVDAGLDALDHCDARLGEGLGHPLERKVELTRGIVEALSASERQPVLRVQTRSPLVTRDIDLFKRFDDVRVNMSITTDSDAVRKRFEPSCASIEQRLVAIETVKAAGIPVSIFLAPLLPIEDPDRFARRIAAIGPDHVYASPFNVTDGHFKGSTRAIALQLAEDYGWTRARAEATIDLLRGRLPMFSAGA